MSVLSLLLARAVVRGRLFSRSAPAGSLASKSGAGGSTPPGRATDGGEKGSTADNPPSAEQPDAGSIPAASTIIPSLWSPALLAAASIAWGLEEEVPDHEPYCWECGRPLDAD